ncbi:MAG: hypothetical protein V2A74_01875, partial [bacterium]
MVSSLLRGILLGCLTLCLILPDREVCAQPPATITMQGSAQATGAGPLTGSRDYRVRFFDSATTGSQL